MSVRHQRFQVRRGFSFLEILVAMVFMMAALGYLFTLMTSSNQGTMDAYNETLAYTLAQETLELVANVGIHRLRKALQTSSETLVRLGYTGYQPVQNISVDDGGTITYPEDYQRLERLVEITPNPLDVPAPSLVKVQVTVRVKTGFFRKGTITLGKLIGTD